MLWAGAVVKANGGPCPFVRKARITEEGQRSGGQTRSRCGSYLREARRMMVASASVLSAARPPTIAMPMYPSAYANGRDVSNRALYVNTAQEGHTSCDTRVD